MNLRLSLAELARAELLRCITSWIVAIIEALRGNSPVCRLCNGSRATRPLCRRQGSLSPFGGGARSWHRRSRDWQHADPGRQPRCIEITAAVLRWSAELHLHRSALQHEVSFRALRRQSRAHEVAFHDVAKVGIVAGPIIRRRIDLGLD